MGAGVEMCGSMFGVEVCLVWRWVFCVVVCDLCGRLFGVCCMILLCVFFYGRNKLFVIYF